MSSIRGKMSKKENKRFQDNTRKTAPKRGGKNRRDYGDSYEPRRARRTAKPIDKPMMQSEAQFGQDGLEVVAGRNPVMEVLNGKRNVERVFIADGAEGSISKIIAVAREQGVIVDFVPKEKIDAMAPDAKHQGVVAKVSAYEYASIEDVFEKARVSGEDPFLILLDEITDPHNLGAIIRTAECAGAHGVIITKRRACSLTQTVALSAAGAIENMPIVQVTNMAHTIENLKKQGIWVAAADMDGENYMTANLTGPIAIVIGNEGKGVGRLVKEKCDFVLSIPMKGTINSLNASNAAAILMYGVRRSRCE